MSKRAEDVTPHVCDSVLMEHCTQPHGNCDKCGKPLDEHPTVNVEGINTLALCQDRAAKWQRVEPGTVIPAGQPYRVENDGGDNHEYPGEPEAYVYHDDAEVLEGLFIDSSWEPALVLPTEPTWGIAVHVSGRKFVDVSHIGGGASGHRFFVGVGESLDPQHILDFIPLTDEQIQRIEAAR